MTESFLNGRVTLHPGDCLDVLARLEENSIDSVVTDPPYHLTSIVKRFGAENAAPAQSGKTGAYKRASAGFMGKVWDGGEIAFEPETWAAVMRVLKPGGHLLAFGAPKNFGFMQYAIAQAGFEVRDVLCWLFGSGFPKSHDVSKGIDRAAGAEREVVGLKSDPRYLSPRRNSPNHMDRERGVDGGHGADHDAAILTAPATDAAIQWSGWGTALKPAYEPIILARKPLSESTVAANVLRWGTGALNIDGCRVATDESVAWNGNARRKPMDGDEREGAALGMFQPVGREGEASAARRYTDEGSTNFAATPGPRGGSPAGRWPANVLHDGSDEVVRGFPDADGAVSNGRKGKQGIYKDGIGVAEQAPSYADSGSAARFFKSCPPTEDDMRWQREQDAHQNLLNSNGPAIAERLFYSSKADSDDRLGSKHPTVKPVDLMQWLVRLVTPKGGTCLDPFAGTGTTGEAAFREGMKAILIEREEEYQADIRRRMALCMSGPDERKRESNKARHGDKPFEAGTLFG